MADQEIPSGEIPKLSESQPVISPVNVNSKAEGYDEFAKTLGALSQKAEEKAEEIASDQSQAMYINSVANAEQLKTTAQMRMIENPGQAPKIAQQTDEALNIVKDNAFVNKKDRVKLNAYISGTSDDVALKATATNYKQTQLEASYTYYANWQAKMNSYYDMSLKDPAKAQQLHDAMLNETHNLVLTGAITPIEAVNHIKTMSNMVDAAKDLHRAGYQDLTAKDYHTVSSNPLSDKPQDPNAPVNQDTAWAIDYYNADKSLHGVLTDVYNRQMPDPRSFLTLPANSREHVVQAINGVKVADGMINSGEPFTSIEKSQQILSEKGKLLSYKDIATRNALTNYIDELKHGNYLQVIGRTPQGNGILENFVMQDTAIKNSPIDDEKKNQLLLQNKNNMVNSAVSYGQAHGIPAEYIQPMPSTEVASVQNAFNFGQDPKVALQILGQYSKANQVYVANAMKNPDQRTIIQGLAFSGNNIPQQDKLDFIVANQNGQPGIGKELQGSTKDKTIMARISSNLSAPMRLVNKNYDFTYSAAIQKSMLDTTMKYAKFLAYKDNNIPMTDSSFDFFSQANWKNYVDKASSIYTNAFQQSSGTNWVVNKNQLPTPTSDSDLDVLAQHVTQKGYERLMEGKPMSVWQRAFGANPLRMVLSPQNELQAVDGSGSVYYSMPFTNNAVPYAKQEIKKRQAELVKESSQQRLENEIKQSENMQTGVR